MGERRCATGEMVEWPRNGSDEDVGVSSPSLPAEAGVDVWYVDVCAE